ncbi:hypothetical protein PTSG_03243 [Salpingoeca rosetta]|uniref:HMG box domain-containing protein n=1 Tax=Salpingoeca rosetta (strain ATCC 50818 / BSB-021) TaxID=946362 RepID=F2U4M4_SALR5|nr:uncharacterized protein PTSG_03243 [Salpingoeca rosetta]EGD82590.1 hypothetical protein PTSG_03243 [Salpingoeca rosetta]|eukprot:XP_004995826.1 hypothetical protein PTSG_03243 [Salpingoeca rosetta]
MSSDDEHYDDYNDGYDDDEHDEEEPEIEEKPVKVKKQRRARRKKDPNKPRGALTPYMCFNKEVRPAIMQQHPNASVTEVAKLIGAQWRQLTDEQKKPYNDMARTDRERYKEAMKNYVPTPGFEEGGRRRKKKKDPNAPKKPKSAYFVFAETRRDALRAQYPEDRVSDTAKRTGEEWRGMTEEQKRPFQLKAQELKQEYDQAVAEYKASLE